MALYTLLIDSREQNPYNFRGEVTEVTCIKTGDYSIKVMDKSLQDEIAIERKSLNDFVGSITSGRERFEKEIIRAKELKYFAIVIEADWDDIENHRYESKMPVNSVIGTIMGWSVKYNIPIFLGGKRSRCEDLIRRLLLSYIKYLDKDSKKSKTSIQII